MKYLGAKQSIRRLAAPLLEALLVTLCLLLISQPTRAASHALDGEDWQFSHDPDWYEPALYSLRVMGLGIAGLVSLDLHDTDPSVENFKRALTEPTPRADDDGPMFNFVLHPLWGSETYLRARSAGMNMRESFAFSMGASVVWEYLIESWTEHPSSQDLVYTTGLGWMIGEGRHYLLQNMDEDNRFWADPLHSMLGHVDLEVRIDPEGKQTPIFSLGWDF